MSVIKVVKFSLQSFTSLLCYILQPLDSVIHYKFSKVFSTKSRGCDIAVDGEDDKGWHWYPLSKPLDKECEEEVVEDMEAALSTSI